MIALQYTHCKSIKNWRRRRNGARSVLYLTMHVEGVSFTRLLCLHVYSNIMNMYTHVCVRVSKHPVVIPGTDTAQF